VQKLTDDSSHFCTCTFIVHCNTAPPQDGTVCEHCKRIRDDRHTIIEIIEEVVDSQGNVIPWPPEGETSCAT
jgi:hypothetical protein